MQRNFLLGVIALIVIIVAIIGVSVWYAKTHLTERSSVTPDTSALPAQGTYTEQENYYDISTQYVTSTPLLGGANEAALSLMRSYLDQVIAQFKTDGNFDHLTAEDIKMMGFDAGRKATLSITHRTASSARTISYIFTQYQDTLGAHGNTFFHTFTFDTSTGAALSLTDVFLPGAPYLSTLSSKARTKLPAILGDSANTEMITAGTTAEEINFENFYFDGSDFMILFAPYQVASYAAGPQTLRIPLSELSTILKPEYR